MRLGSRELKKDAQTGVCSQSQILGHATPRVAPSPIRFPPGATELEIGTAVRDGQTIPVRARLVPTTEGEKKAINN